MNFYFFIQYAVEAEAKLEEIRILLASYEEFEPFTTYKRLDQPRTGGLKEQNIFEFINDNNIEITQDQLDYIFRVLDEDSDGLITYQDFKSAILPKMNDQVKDSALNHKSYELPVDMLLPNNIEEQLKQFFIQIKQNYLQYQQIQEKIDLNQLDIYDNDNKITVDSLKNWLQQQENGDISEEILQNFVILIQGQQQQLQNLLDQIYTENQQDQDEQEQQDQELEQQEDELEQQEEEFREARENIYQGQQEEEYQQFQQQEDLEQVQQKDTEADKDVSDSQQYYQQELQPQHVDDYNLNNDFQSDIDFQIQQLKKKINKLEFEIELQQTNKSHIGQLFEKEYNKELLKYSRISYLRKQHPSPPSYRNDLIRQQLRIEEEIKKEEIKQKILLTQLNNPVKIHSSGYFSNRQQNYSPINKSKQNYISEYSGNKYLGSNKKQYPNSFQRSINFSNRKF